jgi:hypothetical protein
VFSISLLLISLLLISLLLISLLLVYLPTDISTTDISTTDISCEGLEWTVGNSRGCLRKQTEAMAKGVPQCSGRR